LRERLIENWLDRVNERGYQPVFCQALSAQGYTVVHSTRHGPMEFGKDVVARAVDGTYHAYQLKGNPGTRLTIGQWNAEILPQINALMHQPVEPPLSPTAVTAVPYLVTNGEVDEEVHAAIRGINSLASQTGRHELRLISRGELLGTFMSPIANNLWPQTTDIDHHILSCWSLDGADFLPAETFHHVILDALPFGDTPKTTQVLLRAIFAGAVIHELCLRRYAEAENHVSLLLGRAQFLAAAYSLAMKAGLSPDAISGLQRIYWSAMAIDTAGLLADLEGKQSRHFYERDARLEFIYHKPRLLLLRAILCIAAITADRNADVFPNAAEVKQRTNRLIDAIEPHSPLAILGEYVVPQVLFVYWHKCLNSGYGATDFLIVRLLRALLTENAKEDRNAHVPNPYHLMPEVVEALINRLLRDQPIYVRKQSYRHQLWTALPLFGLIVRRNLKSTAANIFPEMTRFVHRTAILKNAYGYGLYRTEDADDHGERLPFPAQWSTYVERSGARPLQSVPSSLAVDVLTLGLFLILCPFRTNEEVVYHIDEFLIGSWHKP